MAKASMRQLQDKYIGPLGLKFHKSISNGKPAFSSPALTEAEQEFVKAVRWWGESYSYFQKKTDSIVFSAELITLIEQKVIRFGKGTDTKSLGNWFVDPETNAVKNETIKSRFIRLEELSEFPIIKFSNAVELPLKAQASVLVVNIDKLSKLQPIQQINVGRIVSIVHNISLLMTSYASEQAAKDTQQSRPALTILETESSEVTSNNRPLILGTIIGSSEIAALLDYKHTDISLEKVGITEQDTKDELGRLNAKYYDYADYLSTTYGVINSLMWEVYPEYTQIESAEVEKSVKSENTKNSEVPKVIKEEKEVKQIEQTPKSEPTNKLNSKSHQFTIHPAECMVTVMYELDKPVALSISAFKVDTITTQYLVTVSKLISKLMEKGTSTSEIAELITGMVFAPNNQESTSILDYVGKWLQQNS
jgi:hypothetical protein